MEKRTPHYPLARIQFDVARLGSAAFTKTALDGGRAMGLTSVEMLEVVASLRLANFYKSMTTHADHRIWQDVYKPVFKGYDLYVKVQLLEGKAMVVSFKAR